MDTIEAIILGIVQGLTEFLPISSTGHQIIVADLMGFGGQRAIVFNIIIQLGAILAVVWEFRRKIIDVVINVPHQPQAQRFTFNLIIAVLPAVVLGVLFWGEVLDASAWIAIGLIILSGIAATHFSRASPVEQD